MKSAHLKFLDLNLILVFDAMMRHRSVTKAAAELGLTQSAISHGIARLRDCYNDPLFRRSKGTMQPTVRALEIAAPLNEALRQVNASFQNTALPRFAKNDFHIGLVDYSATHLLPAIMERLGREAPLIKIVTEVVTAGEAVEHLERDDLDIALGVVSVVPDYYASMNLFSDAFAIIAREKNPLIKTQLTTRQLGKLTHVDIPQLRDIDRRLSLAGIKKTSTLVSNNMLSAPFYVARSDFIAVIPRSVALVYEQMCRLQVFNPPCDLGSYRIDMVWHPRWTTDPGHAWLREVVTQSASSVSKDLRFDPKRTARSAGQPDSAIRQ